MHSIFATLLMSWSIGPAIDGNDEHSYYMIVFASQPESGQPRLSHVSATFVRVSRAEGERPKLTSHTISWLPASMNIVPLNRPEPGKNVDLITSLDWALGLKTKITAFGPYRIKKELYDSGLRRKEQLESGVLAYKMLDARFRPRSATNCIHAVSDLDVIPSLLNTGTARGEAAGFLVAQSFRPWIIRPDVTHQWVMEELGLGKYSIGLRELVDSSTSQ